MRFKYWVEVVARREPIITNQPVQIYFIDPEEDWEQAGVVEQISKKAGIRFNSNKDVSIVASVGDQIIGGVADVVYEDNEWEQPVMTYDFDVVVDPQWQGYQMVGFKLIDAAIRNAQSKDAQMIRTWVVNKRLAPIMQSKYGFEGGPDIFYKWL